MHPIVWTPIIVGGVWVLILLLLILQLLGIYLQLVMMRVPVSFGELVLMRFRRADVKELAPAYLLLESKGFRPNFDALEKHQRAGGRGRLISRVLVIAKEAGIELDWEETTRLDLLGEENCWRCCRRKDGRGRLGGGG
jgi:uncharacterized protein YqfA (UPF0365 family)